MNETLALVICALSTFRISYMLCTENGPLNLLKRMRKLPFLNDLFSCLFCTSVWVGIGHSVTLSTWLGINGIGQTLATGLALSTSAIGIYMLSKLTKG